MEVGGGEEAGDRGWCVVSGKRMGKEGVRNGGGGGGEGERGSRREEGRVNGEGL